MKKIIFAALVSSLFAIGAMAQSRPGIIVSAGYQGSKVTGFDNAKMSSGARAGVAIDVPVLTSGTMQLSVQPGLNFSMKGVTYGNDKVEIRDSFFYVDLPILANLRFDVDSRLNAFVNAGPYLAYGVGGASNSTIKPTEYYNPFEGIINQGKEIGGLRAFDWGLQVGAGVEYSRIMLALGTQVGFYDITPDIYTLDIFGIKDILGIKAGTKNNNTSFFVTLGYRF
ncbi:porin family protein [Porphyromonas levii]|uniref:PorT family protein n=1 Tax=Porphyromonas levii TaxID=28114 RepID=A0A4Y8WQT6_9PORP|nr:porin family protein [Porphyromonas levii]TFH94883.1 PorT family protein [Porphyromonas levii]TFH96311.1 PorT family protein [Porphyromonas levii]